MPASKLSFGPGRQLTYIDYLDALADFLLIYDQVPVIKNKLNLAYQAVSAINQGVYPPTLQEMLVTESDILQIQNLVLSQYPNQSQEGNLLWQRLREPLVQVDFCLRNIRDEFIEDFNMYAYLTEPFLKALSTYLSNRPTLELMAGQGYLSAGLKALKPQQTIFATDNQAWKKQPVTAVAPVIQVEPLDALTALAKYGERVEVVLLSWPPDTDQVDYQILEKMRQSYPDTEFLLIGESFGATGSTTFWEQAHLSELTAINHTRPQFDLIDEKIYRVK